MAQWNVDDYKTQHEPEEQWELRRAFLLKYKQEIPEDELVCLAQTMINIEFLGCRYSSDVMLRIEELAKDILADLRQRRKDRLRRTFVGAADAATAKIKRSRLPETVRRSAGSTSEISEPATKRRMIQNEVFDMKPTDFTSKFGKIIIFDPSTGEFQQSAISLIQIVHNKCKAMVIEEPSMVGGEFRMVIRVNGQIAGTAVSANKAAAKKEAYEEALTELRKYCYTLQVKNSFLARDNETIRKLGEKSEKEPASDKIGEDNIGFKLLKSLGWKGGSLGSKNEGILDPVELSVNIGRRGLGATANSDYYRNILRNYKNTPTFYDLVFTNEFDSDERAVLHKLANQLGLKSKSYSKNENRHLVISKKISIFDMAMDIIERRDPALLEKFILLPPET